MNSLYRSKRSMANVTFTTVSPNSTSTGSPCEDDIPAAWGYISALIAVVSLGSNFIPVKKFETGNGVFFQWIMCCGIMLSGIVVQLVRGSQADFHFVALLGGILWTFGNITVVPIIKTIGMGLGMCIWGVVNLLSGWATGRFGLFGIPAQIPDNVVMNYVGVSLAVSSAVIFSFVKNEVSSQTERETGETPVEDGGKFKSLSESAGTSSFSLQSASDSTSVTVMNDGNSISSVGRLTHQQDAPPKQDTKDTCIDRLSPGMKHVVGVSLCLISGVLYGQTFTGAIYMQSQSGASTNPLDYVFPCFSGIFLTSTFFMGVYAAMTKNKPIVYPQIILPGILSGIIWSIGVSSWFVANRVLSEPVAFPIITAFPSVIASLWGVLLFREIKGMKNLLVLMLGFIVSGVGITLAGLSKTPKSC